MNIARIVVLAIALSAGGVAAYLASGIDSKAPAPAQPVAQLQTVDILVAKADNGSRVVSKYFRSAVFQSAPAARTAEAFSMY